MVLNRFAARLIGLNGLMRSASPAAFIPTPAATTTLLASRAALLIQQSRFSSTDSSSDSSSSSSPTTPTSRSSPAPPARRKQRHATDFNLDAPTGLPPPYDNPLLQAPWTFDNLAAWERELYAAHGPLYVMHAKSVQRRNALNAAARRRSITAAFSKLLGPGWFDIYSEANGRRGPELEQNRAELKETSVMLTALREQSRQVWSEENLTREEKQALLQKNKQQVQELDLRRHELRSAQTKIHKKVMALILAEKGIALPPGWERSTSSDKE